MKRHEAGIQADNTPSCLPLRRLGESDKVVFFDDAEVGMEDANQSGVVVPRVAATFFWVALAAGALLLVAHVVIRPVSPEQASPPGHFGEPCALCHFVSASADLIQTGD